MTIGVQHLKPIKYKGLTRQKPRVTLWLFRCACGVERVYPVSQYRSGLRKHCGCMTAEHRKHNGRLHGKNGTKVYRVWNSMLARCYNKNVPGYKHYGARGIKVCTKWKNFKGFYTDMKDPPSKDHSLDRIDNKKGYNLKNCRWATRKQQANNARYNVWWIIDGKKHTLQQWCIEYGRAYSLVWQRVYRQNWTIIRALTEPTRLQKSKNLKYITIKQTY